MIAENEGLTGAGGQQSTDPVYAFPHGLIDPGGPGMTLLEWYASQEKLTDFDPSGCDFPRELVKAICGPIDKNHDWSKTPKLMFEREAKIRAWMKFTRAQAMLDEANRRHGQ